MNTAKSPSIGDFTFLQPLHSIGQHALACEELFRELLSDDTSSQRQSGNTVARDYVLGEYEKFKLWASNIGVFAEVQSSLDFRLRGLDDIKDSFLAQLTLIHDHLLQLSHSPLFCTTDSPDVPNRASVKSDHEEGTPKSRQHAVEDPPWNPLSATSETTIAGQKQQKQQMDSHTDRELDAPDLPQNWDTVRLLLSIRRSIDWLQRLSNLVRKASFASQDRKAEEHEFDDKEFQVEGLKEFYTWFLKREYNSLDKSLRERIVESMVLRRKRFHYRQKQQQRMCIQPVRARNWKIGLNMATESPPKPADRQSSPNSTVVFPAGKSHTAISNVSTPTVDGELLRKLARPSRISKASTGPMGENTKAFIPTPPAEITSNESFTCPYCYLVLPSDVARDAVSWANHVRMDLHPYVCVADECDGPIEIYASSKEWLAHMRSRHFTRWYCRAKTHKLSVELPCQEDFITHMKIEHPGKFRENQLPYIAQRSLHAPDSIFEACPFCATASGELESHVGEHLRNLALQVLPWPQDIADGANSESDSRDKITSASNVTKQSTRETFGMPDLVFELDPQERGEGLAEKGVRLSEYGFIPKISQEHRDLEPLEQQHDTILANLAMHQSSRTGLRQALETNMLVQSRTLMPFRRDPDFVDRRRLMDEIHAKISKPAAKVALVGLGGTGKSQLAIEYAYRIREMSAETWVIWLHTSNSARFEESIRDNVDWLSIPGRFDPMADQFKLFLDWLSDAWKRRWLLIMDDTAEDVSLLLKPTSTDLNQIPEMLDHLSNCNHGSTLITTRSRVAALRLVLDEDTIAVDSMDEADSIALLESKLGENHDRSHLIELAVAMEFIPLALVQAAAYIQRRRPRCSIQQYLGRLHKSYKSEIGLLNHDMGDLRRDREAKNSILLTWQISFEHLSRQQPSAVELLSLMSFCDNQAIPESLLRNRDRWNSNREDPVGSAADSAHDAGPTSGITCEGEDFKNGEPDKSRAVVGVPEYNDSKSDKSEEDGIGDDGFEDDICTLENYCFISITMDASTFEMHRLVQLATQKWLKAMGQLEYWNNRFISILHAAFPDGDYQNWTLCATLFPHAKAAMSSKPGNRIALLQFATIMHRAADYTSRKGAWSDAESMAVQSVKARESELGPENTKTLQSMSLLATIIQNQGKLEEAEQLGLQLLGRWKRVLGEEHPDILTAIANLALTYWYQGRWDEAEKLFVQVMETRRTVLGAEHPDTLTSMANLASTYQSQGRWEEAEQLEVQVMETSRTVLGVGHPDTLTSMGNLASTYRNQGRWGEAEKLGVQVMETSRTVLGALHPSMLTSMANLASTYRNQGRWGEAETLEVQVMETRRTVLGALHPSTLTSMANLASTYWYQGRWDEAEKLFVQVMETRRTVLGAEHPDTLTSMANLASTYQSQGRWEEAEQLEVQVMETSRTVLGVGHPDTLTSMGNLASTYRNQGRWGEAETLEVQVMETRRTVLGAEHPDTLTSTGNLASTYRNQGRWGEAETLDVQVMETSRTVLGAAHPSTLTSMANLASTYRNQGRWGEAETLDVQVMETRRTVLGAEHPGTLTSMGNLASTYRNQGRWQEAEKLGVQVMETSRAVLGAEHPGTLTSTGNLAMTYCNQGRWTEAEGLLVQVVAVSRKVLGNEHPNTLAAISSLEEIRCKQ